jgi:hypothetical protein
MGFTGYRIVFYKKRSFDLFANDKKSNRHASVDGLEKQLFFFRWEITELFFLFATDKKSNRHASVDGLEKQLFFSRWETTQLFLPVYLPLAMQSTCTCRRLIDGDMHLSTA